VLFSGVEGLLDLTRDELGIVDLINDVKEFSEAELGIAIINGFSTLDLEEGKEFFWVYASPKDRIKNPFEREMPYKFFEDREEAYKLERKLKKEFDTHVFSAYVHGGKRGCPITKGLFDSSPHGIIGKILHEGTHEFKYRNFPEIPYYLEEPIATYVGTVGAVEYCEKKEPSHLSAAKKHLQWTIDFFDFANKYYNLLSECYRNNEKRSSLLRKGTIELREMGFKDKKINNAYLLRQFDYANYYPIVFEEMDRRPIRESIESIEDVVKRLEEIVHDGEEWLDI